MIVYLNAYRFSFSPVLFFADCLPIGHSLLSLVHPSIHWDDGKIGLQTATVIEGHSRQH